MTELYHFPFDPFSRMLRLALAEKGLTFDLHLEKNITTQTKVPSLILDDNTKLVYAIPMMEYLEDAYPNPPLMGYSLIDRYQTRALMHELGRNLAYHIVIPLLDEKIYKTLDHRGEPNSTIIRSAQHDLGKILTSTSPLFNRGAWIGGQSPSYADLCLAANLSVLDYMACVPWDKVPVIKNWYGILKKRPCFAPLLSDYIPGTVPSNTYAKL